MTIQEVVIQYESRVRELQAGIAQLRLPNAVTALILAAAIALFLALGFYAIRNHLSFLWPSLPLPFAAVSAQRLQRNRRSRSRMRRLKRFYDRAIQRVNGNWTHAGLTGEEFGNSGHPYATDLQVFGEGSLFQLLCVARTSIGQRGLANYLLNAPALEETRLRQEAVRELRERPDIRERIAALGEYEFLESKWDVFDSWLNSPETSLARFLPALTAITSALLGGLVLASFAGVVPWTKIAMQVYFLIAFNTVVGLYFRSRVNDLLSCARSVFFETRLLREGLRLIESDQFQSARLRQLSHQVRNGSASIRKLERLLGALHERDKDWFYLPSRTLLAGTQLCMAIEHWRRDHGKSLRRWLEAWSEFEALNALAGYAYENPANVFPEIEEGEACFEAQELGHPLLSHTSCVANDVELSRRSPFYVVSGSNMSGKSTLLRAIGLNAVLAAAGAPVRARALRLSGLSIFASVSVVDSLLNGKSKFLAEVERLRQAIESAVADKPVLFLVDEIFSGTNSRDRRIAAEAVVRTLIRQGAIGVLSTHDLALTEIAGGVNMHMGSRDDRDPMDFDYRLKPGVTTESNGVAIARMAGVPV